MREQNLPAKYRKENLPRLPAGASKEDKAQFERIYCHAADSNLQKDLCAIQEPLSILPTNALLMVEERKWRCDNCAAKKTRSGILQCLSLAMDHATPSGTAHSIDAMLNKYFETAKVEEFSCETCRQKCGATEEVGLSITLSQIATLQIMRYHPVTGEKNCSQVQFPFVLSSGLYELVGWVSHDGQSVNHGHYYATAMRDNEWFEFNDETVSRVAPPGEFNNSDRVHLLFYKKRDTNK